jgi:hypothetical protein
MTDKTSSSILSLPPLSGSYNEASSQGYKDNYVKFWMAEDFSEFSAELL